MVKRKSTNFTICPNFFTPSDRLSSQGELKKMKLCLQLVNYIHYVCAKFHTNRTIFSVKRLARRKVVERKSKNFTRCPIFFAPSDRISSQSELKKLKLCMYLIKYFNNACAKIHPRPKILRVKRLARQKVVKPKSTKFTRCSTYSASNDKTSSQVELKKMKLCM